jgi:hypothetical protein
MVGKDKFYSAADLVEKHHSVNGTAVDRFSATVNLDSPMLKLPGQKEQIQAFWPDGKLEFDYAIQNDRLLMASSDRMKDLLGNSSATNPKSSIALEESTCFVGHFNLLGIVVAGLRANPAIPGEVKEKFARLDPQHTSIDFQVSLDNQVHANVRVPMKLIRELGRLGEGQ